ncbi:MAG: enoyl-CoA hydratase [Acidimicrobiales bacterium]
MTDDVLRLETDERVALVTLHRPDVRNALNRALLQALRETMASLDADDDIDAVVLTGADPAFCAGLDLKELGRGQGVLNAEPPGAEPPSADPASPAATDPADRAAATRGRRSVLPISKPIIGAVNGVAVTGGLELALNCDFLVASERARFADTHARVGVQPLWGLTVLLPEAIGLRRAREMSTTGNFVDAPTALSWGLVNHMVAHDELVPFALGLARDITSSDQRALARLLRTYQESSLLTGADAWRHERDAAAEYHQGQVDSAEVERRRSQVMDRGRSQI